MAAGRSCRWPGEQARDLLTTPKPAPDRPASPVRRPHILFVFSDQQRCDTLGCYGQPLPVTPNLDRMAAEGGRFEYAFTCPPVCGPARACLPTGKYATETGVFHNDIALPRAEKTLAHYLSQPGYEVGYLGKWHPAPTGPAQNYRTRPVPRQRRGGYRDSWLAAGVREFTSPSEDGYLFDEAGDPVEFSGYRVDALTDFALDYLRTPEGDRPSFLLARASSSKRPQPLPRSARFARALPRFRPPEPLSPRRSSPRSARAR